MNPVTIDILHESALLLAAVCVSLGILVLSRAIQNKLHLAYAALSAIISVWAFSFFVARVLHLRAFETVHLNTTLLLAPVALVFMDVLLRPSGWIFKTLRYLAYGILILFFPLVTMGLDRHDWIRQITYYSPAAIMLALVYLFIGETLGGVLPRSGLLVLPSRDEVVQALKKRNLWIYGGGFLVTLVCTMDRVSWMGRTVPALGNLALAVYLYFLKDVVLQHHLLSPRRTLGRLLADGIAAVFVAFVFVLLTMWVRESLVLLILNGILAAAVAVVILNPIRSLALLAFEKFFFKEASRMNVLVQEASKELVGAATLQAIGDSLQRFLKNSLEVSPLSFYALAEEAHRYRLVFSEPGTEFPAQLPRSFPLAVYWERLRHWKPILERDLELEADRTSFFYKESQLASAVEAMQSLKSNIAIPLLHERKLLGFVTIQTMEDAQLGRENWGVLTLLQPYFQRAAAALHELDLYAQLRQRDRMAMLGEMATGLAHEIRNPLGAIKGAVQVLDSKAGDPNTPFLKIIEEETNRLNHVVAQFLDYAKPFRSEFRIEDMNVIIAAAVARLRRTLPETIELVWSPSPAVPRLLCQPELLGQVLTNLLENARQAVLEHKEQAKKQILVHLGHTPEKNEIWLEVRDNGVGIAPENREKIFIPFFTSFPKGTGLGLAICQRIVEAHNGRLEIDSDYGKGTSVLCYLPLR